ncbi:MAG: glycerol-3-phosphate 1-O-acyltransferase PlsY [Deltaproteobacteria bacterium]|nr:glycerol-3-phosphate 1-O-acyltransferase PlsY [Deltaproteobacteria bacterium]
MEALVIKSGLILGAYLGGAIPTGLILGRIFASIDVRKYGSRNIGATNVYRNLGKKLGTLTLLGDILKGFLPVYLVYRITGAETWILLAALATFFGHLYPIFLKFSGGKGVATALGAFLFLSPKILIINVMIFILILFLFRYVSLSSISAASSMPLLMGLSPHPYPNSYILTATIIAIRELNPKSAASPKAF